MGAPQTYDPDTIRPGRGLLLVEIVEKLGGKTDGGIELVGAWQDRHDKDTCYSRVLKVGPKPDFIHGVDGDLINVPTGTPDPGVPFWRDGKGVVWPTGFAEVSVGEVVLHPRDMPLTFLWPREGSSGSEYVRYGLVWLHECIAVLDNFDKGSFRQICYAKAAIEDSLL